MHLAICAIVVSALPAFVGIALEDAKSDLQALWVKEQLDVFAVDKVREEVQATSDQVVRLNEALRRINAKLTQLNRFERLKETQAALQLKEEIAADCEQVLRDVFSDRQRERLKQIAWQRAGMLAVTDPEVAKSLQLSPEQLIELDRIREEVTRAEKKLDAALRADSSRVEAADNEFQNSREKGAAKISDLLKPEQRAEFKQLLGTPFEVRPKLYVKTGAMLHDSFIDNDGTLLAQHRMRIAPGFKRYQPGWQTHGTGSWIIRAYQAQADHANQSVVVVDPRASTGTLTCDLMTPATDAKGMDAGLVAGFVDNDNYWLVAFRAHPFNIEAYKKVNGAYHSLAHRAFTFEPHTSYRIKVVANGKTLTVFINNTQQVRVAIEDGPVGTQWGLRDNSTPGKQPGWSNFHLTGAGVVDIDNQARASRSGSPSGDRAKTSTGSTAANKSDVATNMRKTQTNLKRLAKGMHVYHDGTGHFPLAIIRDKQTGKPLLSWRVELLAWIGEGELYTQFNMDEPWDGPHNRQLLDKMPKVYASPNEGSTTSKTHYQVFVGGGALFEPDKIVKFGQVSDGTSNTLMIVEAPTAVPWSKPEDIEYHPDRPVPKLTGLYKNGFNAALVDAQVGFFPENIDSTTLRALITKNGGEVFTMPKVNLESANPERDAPSSSEEEKERPGSPIRKRSVSLTHEPRAEGLAFSDPLSNGQRLLASAGFDKAVRLWDVSTGRQISTLHGHKAAVLGVAIARDGKLLASADTSFDVKLWDLATGRERYSWKQGTPSPSALVFFKDGKKLACGRIAGGVSIYDVEAGKLLREFSIPENDADASYTVALSPDESLLAAPGHRNIYIWKLATGKLEKTLPGRESQVISLAFSPDGKTMLSGSRAEPIRIWDVASWTDRPFFETFQSNWITFSPDGNLIICGGDWAWDAHTGVSLLRGMKKRGALLYRFTLSPDGRLMATSYYDGTILLWDVMKPPYAPINVKGTPLRPAAAIPGGASRRTTISRSRSGSDKDLRESASAAKAPVDEDPRVAEYFSKHPKLLLREVRLRPDRGPSWLGIENRANPFQEIPITAEDCKFLARSKTARVVDLQRLKITDDGLMHLAAIPQLEELTINAQDVTDAGMRHLARSKSLRKLSLFRTEKVTDEGIKALAALPRLRSLFLYLAKVKGPVFEAFVDSKTLQSITLNFVNGLTDEILKDLGKLENLNDLKIGFQIYQKKLTTAGIKAIVDRHMPAKFEFPVELIDDDLLVSLVSKGWLYGPVPPGIEDRKPATPADVTSIDLGSSKVTDKGVKSLLGFTNVKSLSLQETGVTDETLKSLATFKKLESMYLAKTKVSAAGLDAISAAPIRHLGLQQCVLTEDAFTVLGKMSSLEALWLDNSKMNGDWLEHIAALPKLKDLHLSHTDFNDVAAEHVTKLNSLEELIAQSTQLNDKGFAEILKMPKLRRLWLDETRVSKEAYLKAKKEHPKVSLSYYRYER
jgi:WD40 repeat protein